MAKRVFDLEGRVGLQDKDFLAKVKRIRASNKALRQEMQLKAGTLKPTKEYRAMEKQVKQAEKAVQDLHKQQEKQAKAHTRSPEYKQMEKDVAAVEAQLDKLVEEQIALAEAGITHGTLFNDLEEQIERTRVKLDGMKSALQDVAATGATDKETRDWFATADAIDRAEKELEQYRAQQARMVASGSAYQKAGGQGSFFKKLQSGFSNARKQLKKYIPLQALAARGFGRIGKQANKMKRGLFMGSGIRGLVRLGVAGAIALYSIRMLKEGLENLRQYDQATNASIQALSNSLATLKNALATAFAPILNVVAPILARFIDWLTAGITAIAHFMAALTGQSQVTIARKTIGGVASSAGSAADNTNAANDAAKEYQKTLMGFDQINKLDDPTAGSAGGGNDGAGGGGVGGAGSMFETVPIDSTMQNWADKIKEAWEKADFYEIGRAAGEKLKAGLEAIDWDKIQEVGRKFGKSVATGLNGFFETPELGKTIGDTIAEALNTVVITVDSFTINFHWDSLGKFVGESITGFFDTFDWKLTGTTMSNLAKGILDATITAVQSVDWQNVGNSIMTMLTSIDYAGIGARLITLIGSGISGALNLLDGAIEALRDALKRKIESGEIWADIGKVLKVTGEATLDITLSAGKLVNGVLKIPGEVTASLVFSGIGWLYEKLTGKDPADPTVKVKLEQLQTAFGDFLSRVFASSNSTIDIIVNFVQGAVSAGIKWIIDKISGGNNASGSIDLKANITEGVNSLKNSSIDMVARFTSWVKAFSPDDIAGWVAKFTKKTYSAGVDTVSGWVARFTKKAIAVGGSAIGGFTATISRVKNALSARAKQLKGFTAVISRVINKVKTRVLGKADGGVYSGGRWRPVQSYAGGGSPVSGQMFIAREAGPELVGTIGGNTAVMNNDQIVASVSDGVARAMVDVMRNFADHDGTSVVIEGDMAQFFRVVQQKAVDYTRATGQPAFPA